MDRLVEPGLIPTLLKATLEIKVFFVIKKATSENLRSLHHVSVACLQKPLRVLTTLAPRVFHIGDWSVPDHLSFLSSVGWVPLYFSKEKTFIIDFFLQWVAQQQREDRMPRGLKGKLENSRKYEVSAFPKEVILLEENIFITKLIPIHFRLELLRARSKKLFKLGVGNGGWGDLRDHQLCLNISHHR